MALSEKAQQIRELRSQTLAPLSDCKKALEQTKNLHDAVILLREWGFPNVQSRSKLQNHAFVTCYTHHNNQVGVMVEIRTETDFCAQTDEVKTFARQLAMHIAASRPLYIGVCEVSPETRKEWEEQAFAHAVKKQYRIGEDQNRIFKSRFDKFVAQNCLLHQLFLCDEKVQRKVEQIVAELCQKTRERVTISRFTYYQAGGEEIHANYITENGY